ncbi:carbon-nitrogen hydrolase family protein [Cohnella ginsengisoli]|uniref:Carbon-nitrogen hydrolase family protein n=1 Tax=Cohnella ginsengisoli TaxID=425004 RepID=A0A9X4KEJ5_9BACL|nr:carbon-nitrogen hydrolase family protein [Cohnella ginsengisoli]MDG0790556.1 carbon-nitrogen hydrolase family protein [Cohnella ginsengisoli]
MSNYVKISTIGSREFIVDELLTTEEIVDRIIKHLQQKLSQVLPEQPDIIVLPEFCDIPFNVFLSPAKTHEYCQVRGDRILRLFSDIAREHGCYIAYPTLRQQEDQSWRNSIALLDRSGDKVGEYAKNYLTLGEIEDYGVTCGTEAPIIDCDFGRIACAICFDLNFDRLRLQYVESKPDLILFSSLYHGGIMQPYWAYSCRSHFVGAIGGGQPSAVLSPVGEVLASSTNYFDFATTTVNLDCAVVHLDYNMERLRGLKSKYGSKVKIADPGYLGSVLISCETDECTIEDIIQEFNIERLDDYLDRATAWRAE